MAENQDESVNQVNNPPRQRLGWIIYEEIGLIYEAKAGFVKIESKNRDEVIEDILNGYKN